VRITLTSVIEGEKTWQLPFANPVAVRLAGEWLAVQTRGEAGQTISLLDLGAGTRQDFMLGADAPEAWAPLADGSLLIAWGTSWGQFRHQAGAWEYLAGQPLPATLSAIAALPAAAPSQNTSSPAVSASYSQIWDTRQAAAGSHTIAAVATDDGGLTGQAQITVQVQNVILIVSAVRHGEALWIIRHDYADITVHMENPTGAQVSKYILERGMGGSWSTLQEISPASFQGGSYQTRDNDLKSNTAYGYRVKAVDANGRVIAVSDPVTI
jgi:hypothetical protein